MLIVFPISAKEDNNEQTRNRFCNVRVLLYLCISNTADKDFKRFRL